MQPRKIAVIGLGYVGLPAAVAFARHGQVIGFDKDPRRINELQNGHDRTSEVADALLQQANVLYSVDPQVLDRADFFIIAVPTPVDAQNNPDLQPVLKASKTVGQHLKPGDIVVYESTVYPGATEEVCVPVLERESGLRCGVDFSVGYSPERINPGDHEHAFHNTVKIVSGLDAATLETVAQVYESVVEAGVHRAPNIKVAEAAKVIENTQRDINIAIINELAMIFDRLGIDTHDVLAVAGSKWNFLKFTPGLVGGHCIGVDPYYLIDKARRVGYAAQVLPAARQINDGMGDFVARRIVDHLVAAGCLIPDSTVTILGLSFKENVPDLRNTRVVDIVQALPQQGIRVQVTDPYVDVQEAQHEYQLSILSEAELLPAQCVVLAVAHHSYVTRGWDFVCSLLERQHGAVMDIKGVLSRTEVPENVLLWRL